MFSFTLDLNDFESFCDDIDSGMTLAPNPIKKWTGHLQKVQKVGSPGHRSDMFCVDAQFILVILEKVVELGEQLQQMEVSGASMDFKRKLVEALLKYWVNQAVIFYSKDIFHSPAVFRQVEKNVLTQVMISILLMKAGLEMNPGPNNRIQRKKTGRRRKRRTKNNNSQQLVVARQGNAMQGTRNLNVTVSRPGQFQLGMPSNFYARLAYVIPLTQVTGAGTTNSLKYSTNAYDVDAALGSTAMAYFTELAAIYSRFRTLAMHYQFEVSNSETFPIQIVYGFSTVSFSATGLGANYAENRFLKSRILSQNNGNRQSARLTGSVKNRDLFGTVQTDTDDLFTGSTTSSTLGGTSTGYCYVGGVWAAIPVAGLFVCGRLMLDLEFSRRNDIIL